MKTYFYNYLIFFLTFTSYSQYDHQKTWCTYYFGNASYVTASVVDNLGDVIIVGKVDNTVSNNIPVGCFLSEPCYFLTQSSNYYTSFTSIGCHQSIILDASFVVDIRNPEGFIAKFNSQGALLWATYFGGGARDYVFDLAIDSFNNIYIVGQTYSLTNIATSNSYLPSVTSVFSNNRFGYLTKFSPSGQQLWGTYIAGNVYSISINSNNEVFIAGITYSSSTITTVGAFQEELLLYPGTTEYTFYNYQNDNGFIMKFDANGNRLAGTYAGKCFFPKDMTTDSAGNVIVVGFTYNEYDLASFPSLQPNFGGGETDGVIMKFTGSLSGRFWSTYFGGNISDEITAVKTIGTTIYITGNSNSTSNVLATAGTHQPNNAGMQDGFIAKFNQFGYRQWCSFYGGEKNDFINSLEINNGKLYVSGTTKSTTAIATSGVYQEVNNSGTVESIKVGDGFFAEFSTTGQHNWGSYFGGAKHDYCQMIFSPTLDGFYLVGSTESETDIATAGSLQENLSIGILNPEIAFDPPSNIYVAKFDALPLSNKEFKSESFTISPNPSNGKITIKKNLSSNSNDLELQLFDIQARLIDVKTIKNIENQEVDFSTTITKGVYVLKITDNKKSSTFKIIIE